MSSAPPQKRVMVFRDGRAVGEVHQLQLESLLAQGALEPGDYFADPESGASITVLDFLNSKPRRAFERVRPSGEDASDRAAGESGSTVVSVVGWVLFLLAISGLAGALYWVHQSQVDMAKLRGRIGFLEKELAAKQAAFEGLQTSIRDVAEPGVVRGRVILRDKSGHRIPLPGVKLLLFRRDVIEEYLSGKAKAAPALESDIARAAYFATPLPEALAEATTDREGRYEFQLAEPGEYIIHTSIASNVDARPGARLWFVAFDSRDPINTPVDITETNGVVKFDPVLMVVGGRQ